MLQTLDARLSELGRRELGEVLCPLVRGLQSAVPLPDSADLLELALAVARRLYGASRSAEALPLARAALGEAGRRGDSVAARRAATACGLLSADSGDLAGAIEHHVQALRLAGNADDRAEMSRVWNNVGLTMTFSGNYAMAARCYERALALIESQPSPVYSRYAACGNLADCFYQVGDFDRGLQSGERALGELTSAFRDQDPYGAILLRRNLVRLLLAKGRNAEAELHVAEALALAERSRSPRTLIAAATTRAALELATGHSDLALTRLEGALARAREVPAALRDTLACVIRAEEAAGSVERALLRLEELSQHVYRFAITRAREHVELADLRPALESEVDPRQAQTKARLISKVAPPQVPDGWGTLQRLAVSAAMRMDESGWHGMRVGALTKALALANGESALRALDFGLAAELHDIGMLSVPERILGKKSPLNAAERSIVERHSEAGAEILRDDRHPRVLLAREIARYHHARWDGKGYPERVDGKRIPLGARMCALADAYDVMVCGIGAGPAKTMDQALRELRREAGKQFDPELVATFEKMIRTESAERGVDMSSSSGMEGFQELVLSLQEDRGFV